MSNKPNIQETLVSVGFSKNYIVRAFKVYEKNYGHNYNIDVIAEIISRLQNKDRAKKQSNAEPPKPFCGPKYGQSQTHNIPPNMNAINRSSSGKKCKRKPNKPPPTNPLPSHNVNTTNKINMNNKHIKSQSQSSQYKPNDRKRKFDDMNEKLMDIDNDIELEPSLKKIKLMDIDNDIELEPSLKKIKLMDIDNDFIDYKKENDKLKKEKETLKQENKTLKQRLDLFECKSEKIQAMNLNELNELKIRMQNKIKLIEESEKELIDNTYKCLACMDHAKNISFIDGCSHVALCDECEQSLETKCCPICQTPYTNVKKINF